MARYNEYWLKDIDKHGDCHDIIGILDSYKEAVERFHRVWDSKKHCSYLGYYEIEKWSCIGNDDEGLIDREIVQVWRWVQCAISTDWSWMKWE